ncbi:1,2-phenylacetyl-CoA epoxidase subunit PaaD [Crenobacter luteus]|uniref:Phenylacetate-CoA oxygenase subunit PaaJ n=1 Tax=Crenobacter luteus TaxID=1452487 RepID=A0A165ENW4_9NEIS|nr:1,2-phenylacetyl-CoA epoxidase subunit PaaD [Crenobacter luteus]KZE27326.1 phenylacetate-CoA oxygenase subunit PaaJ [Crenobacter luteus]
MLTESQAWAVIEAVPDPEIPVLSLCDLGIVRAVRADEAGLTVTLTPTYSGCPATEVIEASVRDALVAAGVAPDAVRLTTQLSPAWTTDWISEDGRRKLREYGIAPPEHKAEGQAGEWQVIRFTPKSPACPHCGSRHTERLSQFGATACKALYRCGDCREPFEYFKPI